ncbi:MAG: beta-ketoacyl-ACP synthase III [Desulfuromonadaceae bacterium]|nr:beta-ketoacyl-ACP synthase III [Desulfuromonadaceae bacterium]
MDVFISDISVFLPNAPVENDTIENILGMVHDTPSRTKNIILRNNRIKRRYYAIDPATGATTHSNAQLAAEAIRALHPYPGFSPDDITCLCCATSQADQLMPGHASMVHGELASRPCEIVSTAGVCVSGMMALKYAFMNVAQGLHASAVACASELASPTMRGRMSEFPDPPHGDLAKNPELAFNADFLRWMLSDGAGAAYLTAERPPDRLALRIDWIEIISYASEMETCMYMGANKNPDGSLTFWRDSASPQDIIRDRMLLLKQDVKLLNEKVIPLTVGRPLTSLIQKYGISGEDFDWFLPHFSSHYFRQPVYDQMKAVGCEIPDQRWFTNLYEKGNTGSASIFVIMEELLHSGRLKAGERILCYIPESGRFATCFVQLTVV